MNEYLKDKEFLDRIIKTQNKTMYTKITVLDFDENPIQEIQGDIVGGNISLDGNSSLRRTCNLQLLAKDYLLKLTDVKNLLSINKKIKVEIGLSNNTNSFIAENIIWFPLGIYVIITPSISKSMNGISISLQLKDKMCLLNGECGGSLPASVVFHEYETIDENGKFIIKRPVIFQIIQELVNHFGKEQLKKIIINDVDTRIKKVMKWTGSTPLYIIKNIKDNETQYIATTNEKDIINKNYDVYEYGRDVGYIYTDFIYPGELISNAGDSICSILDKIKNTLGNYEYFYDVNGNFIFQEIKNYLNTTQARVDLQNMKQNNYIIDHSNGKSEYTFKNGDIVSSYSNTPQFNMIKNDFIVWGIRKNAMGQEMPIRYHLAIDSKPRIGNTYKCFLYQDPNDKILKAKCPINFSSKKDFPLLGEEEIFYLAEDEDNVYRWNPLEKTYIKIFSGQELKSITTSDWRSELYLSGAEGSKSGIDTNDYYAELANEWTKIYDLEAGSFKEDALRNPSDIDFFLDFIDSSSNISEFSISNIGKRSKVINDNSVNCMFEPEIPNLVLINIGASDVIKNEIRQECEKKGQDFIQVDENIYKMIVGGGNFNSAYNLIKELLYQYTSYNESVTLNTLPVYFLEPNTRITIHDTDCGIYGDYMIHTISIPLTLEGTMTISCTKAIEKI